MKTNKKPAAPIAPTPQASPAPSRAKGWSQPGWPPLPGTRGWAAGWPTQQWSARRWSATEWTSQQWSAQWPAPWPANWPAPWPANPMDWNAVDSWSANDNWTDHMVPEWPADWSEFWSHWRAMWEVDTLADLIRMAPWADRPLIFTGDLDRDDLRKLVTLLGENAPGARVFDDVREITPNPASPGSRAESLADHPLHTDGTFVEKPPSMVLMYFSKTDQGGGGRSRFLPIYDVLDRLDAEWVKALALGWVRFERCDGGGSVDAWEGPLLSHDDHGRWLFRWRYDDQVKPVALAGEWSTQEAIEAVKALVDTLPWIEFTARPGQLVLFPNRTWLHGRTPLSDGSERLVWRAWIS